MSSTHKKTQILFYWITEKNKWCAVMLLWLRLEKSIAANLYFRMSELKVFQLNQGLCFQKRPLILLPRLLRTLRTCRWKKLSWFWNFWVCRKSWAVLFFSLPGNALLSMRTVNFQLCSKTIYQISKFRDAVTAIHKTKKPAAPPTKRLLRRNQYRHSLAIGNQPYIQHSHIP